MKVFLDTNIILDTLVERFDPRLTKNAMIIMGLGENGVLDLYMSVLSVPTIAYVLKNISSDKKKSIISDLLSIVKILPSYSEHIHRMLESQMQDIEDVLQVQSAKEGHCDVIVTRNLSDFRIADLPSISPDELLARIIE